MNDDTTRPFIFDGHNDMLLRLVDGRRDPVADFLNGRKDGHLDLPRMRAGGFGGGLFAVFVPSGGLGDGFQTTLQDPAYGSGLPTAMSQGEALPAVLAMVSMLYRLEAAADGAFRICRSVADIRAARAAGAVAAVLHFEGAEAIDPDFHALDVFYAAGLRSLGPVWSRPTLYGHGVPFAFPGSPDTGDGLTAHGEALVRACNARKIAIDLSHLNEKGFWDVAGLSDAPLIASHSNAHTICPHARNLTDDQLRAVRDSGGIVGLNFGTYFLREDGRADSGTGTEIVLRHLDHMLEIMGSAHIGLGSDFDGIRTPPAPLADGACFLRLDEAMRAHGYPPDTIDGLSNANWLRVLEACWGG